jgi:hypothetical protein
MRHVQLTRFFLVGAAWLLAAIALPLPCCDLNRFLAWRGTVSTLFFIQWIFSLPRSILQDYLDPAKSHGTMGGRLTARFDVAGLDLAWLAAITVGFLLFAASPVLLLRVRSLRGATILRCLAPALFLLPLTTLFPVPWRYPLPLIGMYLLAAAHGMVAIALILHPKPTLEPAFPISIKE